MEELKKSIIKTYSIPEAIVDDFISYWETISIPKGTILSEPDRTDKYLYFTLSGYQKAYYVVDGKQCIISFTQPNHFTCAPESFLTNKPSKYYFECITDSVFYRLSYRDFILNTEKHQHIQRFFMEALMGLVNNITDRFIKQTSLTIEEKYKDFMNKNAQLIHHIPQKDIANFLSINPTNFSKLINKVPIQ
ncbi:Crp/Fnr family transcriptional regulator [Flammeovirga agarivorans]|uniref:Crp/Fnr family transcriptional regulator n=1 Tax=Flammeovirga agarivorans TaxID=2726742 RepID=A0A7X8XVV8_9BACT|nr:Crp/Fnr family transcriptional regulator [Flammeovirga agarivorans]NLR91460.1 Crp/Fnr family transcriptional regulator [Flammeovirga agarivorans]